MKLRLRVIDKWDTENQGKTFIPIGDLITGRDGVPALGLIRPAILEYWDEESLEEFKPMWLPVEIQGVE